MKRRATHDDFGRAVELRVGDELEVELQENATTGFFWQAEADAPDIVEPAESAYALPLDAEAAGAAGARTLRFVARNAGTARLALRLVCSWLPDERPDAGVIEVHVRP